jgi:uncharacterized protein YigA (DUF484 family)
MNCEEFAHFKNPVLNIQHHEILETLDLLMWQLEMHDEYEKKIVDNPSKLKQHWSSHESALNKIKNIRSTLIDHINHADTKLFN